MKDETGPFAFLMFAVGLIIIIAALTLGLWFLAFVVLINWIGLGR